MARKKKVEEELELLTIRDIEELSIGQATEDAIIDAASYIDNQRALAYVIDGCKPSYRRLIWAALQFPKGVMQPSVEIINKMASYHPHSLDSMRLLQAAMVKSGIFTGKGAFGMTSILGDIKEPGAPRYTKTRLSDLYYDIIAPLLQCVDRVESPVGAEEMSYCPTVFPLCLFFKSLVSGIGYGISTTYPNFSPSSMYQALIHDDPMLLEPNVDLLMDKENSELHQLWETGKGRVIYSYKLSPFISEEGKKGFLFEGDTSIFTPNLRKINKLVDSGNVFIDDLTDINGPKMSVCLVNNRGVSIDDLEKLCRQCCYDATVYQLNVTDGTTCFRIPMRDWLRYTYDNYIKLLGKVNEKKIEKARFDIEVQKAIPVISNYIVSQNPAASDKELTTRLGLAPEIVEAVMSKPISHIRRNKDTTERVKLLKQRLDELLKFNPVEYTEQIISKI